MIYYSLRLILAFILVIIFIYAGSIKRWYQIPAKLESGCKKASMNYYLLIILLYLSFMLIPLIKSQWHSIIWNEFPDLWGLAIFLKPFLVIIGGGFLIGYGIFRLGAPTNSTIARSVEWDDSTIRWKAWFGQSGSRPFSSIATVHTHWSLFGWGSRIEFADGASILIQRTMSGGQELIDDASAVLARSTPNDRNA